MRFWSLRLRKGSWPAVKAQDIRWVPVVLQRGVGKLYERILNALELVYGGRFIMMRSQLPSLTVLDCFFILSTVLCLCYRHRPWPKIKL